MNLNPQQAQFVNAYVGEAQGNATKAARAAGYSEKTAAQSASRLLKQEHIQHAISARLEKHDLRTDAILKRLAKLAYSVPDKVTGADVIGASKVILQVNGAFAPEKPQVTEKHYYFGSLEALLALRRDSTPTVSSQVMTQPASVLPALPEAIPGEIVG